MKLSLLLVTLLPNDAWRRRLRAASPADRVKYRVLRIGLAILLLYLLFHYRPQTHFALY